jgi:hypothetical protein
VFRGATPRPRLTGARRAGRARSRRRGPDRRRG